MGWLIAEQATRLDTIRRRTKDWTNEDEGIQAHCLRKCLRGHLLWTVWELTRRDGPSERMIACDRLGTDGCGNWGYKPLPLEDLSCPIEYFTLVPPENPEWRAAVLAARFRAPLRIGDRIQLKDGYTPSTATITRLKPLRARADDGLTYRLSRRQIVALLPPASSLNPSLFS